MPNPFEPIKPSPLSTSPPLSHYPEFLPPSAFNPTDWPTWSSIEPSLHDLITNSTTPNNNINNFSAHARNASTVTKSPTTPLRKRRPSKPADSAQQHQPDPALSLERERFGVNEIVEALRGKVEVERVVGRLMEERREFWCAGKGQGVSDGEEGDEGEDGKADVSMDA